MQVTPGKYFSHGIASTSLGTLPSSPLTAEDLGEQERQVSQDCFPRLAGACRAFRGLRRLKADIGGVVQFH